MAKLPYTYTICPPQEEPKRFTASCKEMGILLSNSPDGNLTIDDRRNGLWESWEGKGVAAEPFEDTLRRIARSRP
jgi:hypothetical protein